MIIYSTINISFLAYLYMDSGFYRVIRVKGCVLKNTHAYVKIYKGFYSFSILITMYNVFKVSVEYKSRIPNLFINSLIYVWFILSIFLYFFCSRFSFFGFCFSFFSFFLCTFCIFRSKHFLFLLF